MRTILIAVVAATTLSACGFMTPVKQYPGAAQEVSSIAVVKGYIGMPFSEDHHVTIVGYTKMGSAGPGEQKAFGIPGFTDYPSEIHLLAGDYKVQVYCFKGFSSYRPSTSLALEAGKTYLLQCGVRDGQAFIDVRTSAT